MSLDNLHFNRGDLTSYRIRSSKAREYYNDKNLIVHSPDEIKKGDLLIDFLNI
ncbi:phospho-sugar glycosidase domain-containing protein [Borrelia hermsii]|uniref:phospho-sugar glycosidase domain-containing protein n=1 Tax=Borrelia hermsii TaxID=140 RepID=UPI0030B8266C